MSKYHRLSFTERERISKEIYAEEKFSCQEAETSSKYNQPGGVGGCGEEAVVVFSGSFTGASSGEETPRQATETRYEYSTSGICAGETEKGMVTEEIAERLKREYPRDMTMRISHEAIYQYLYCLPRGELKKELMRGLRREQKQRLSRQARHYRRQRIQDIISISERPKEVRERIVPGHWEGDLIVAKDRASALGTLVERTTRLTLLVPLTAKDAFTVRKSFAKSFKRIPKKFRKSLTYDRGSETSQHKLFTEETDIQVFFADPQSPWQRGTNENTNGLIRQYLPKGTDFRTVTPEQIAFVEARLNSRPRKTLYFYTPSEKFYSLITKRKIALTS